MADAAAARFALTPALDADEWVRVSNPLNSVWLFGSVAAPGRRTKPLREIMAVANYALPESHPGRLTREDERWLRALADGRDVDQAALREWAAQMRAKLDALLPPEFAA